MLRCRSGGRVRVGLLVAILLLSMAVPALVTPVVAGGPSPSSSASDTADSAVSASAEAVGGTGTNTTANGVAAGSDGSTIHRSLVLSLTPKFAGEIGGTMTFEMPSNVRAFETTLPEGSRVTSTRGFSRSSGQTYAWDGTTTNPRIRFVVPVNKSSEGTRAAQPTRGAIGPDSPAASQLRRGTTQSGAYSFVDTGPWALVSVPRFSSSWRYVGERPTLEKTVSVDGAGATGGEIAYLGPHRTIEKTAHGQRFELIIPEAATLRASPETIFDSITHASNSLRVGSRDEHVFMVAAPTTVAWQAAGIEYGGNDFWVKADERVDDPRNVWLHEYVHTRQEYQPTAETQWTAEATAEYYAALLTLHQKRISFTAFRRHLDRGTRETVTSSILADPSTWSASTPYLKGALVYGNIDRQIRVDSNGTRSMQVVLSQMNADPDEVSASEFYSLVESAGNANTRTYAERFADSQDVPSPWSGSEHEAAFTELPSRISYRTADVRVTGEYRDDPLGESPTLTTGESVTATIEVTNTGGAAGTFETAMYVDGTPVATSSGSVSSEATRMVTLTHTFESAGTYTLNIGGKSRTVVVEDPAAPQVTELVVNASQSGGEWTATITVSVGNPTDRPAHGSVPVTVDDETVEMLDVNLGPNESVTRTVTTSISPGTHTISAGSVSTSLDIPTASSGSKSPVYSPGFGPIVACLAILLTILAHARFE